MKKKVTVLTTCILCAAGIIVGASAAGLIQHTRYKATQPAQPEPPINPNVSYNVQPPDSTELPNSVAPNSDALNSDALNSNPTEITMEQAKAIALNKAGHLENKVIFEESSRDFDDGREVYEIEFKAGGVEYSAEILVSDGTVVSWEVDRDFDDYTPSGHHAEHH